MEITIGHSGGRTSAYMAWLLKQQYPDAVPIFCDTGAEHPKTYKFLRDCERNFNFGTVAIRAVVNHGERASNDYEVLDLEACAFELSTMASCMRKYGGFTNNRPWCTDKLKGLISDKFRSDLRGSDNTHWLGIRCDEPKRLVGAKLYKTMIDNGIDKEDISDIYIKSRCGVADDSLNPDVLNGLQKRCAELDKKRIHFLAEISDFDKQDVLNWWSKQPFDLEIDEHLGNCVFCIKKSELKVALAARDEPELFNQWRDMHMSESVRLMPADKHGRGHIYRKWLTPDMLIAQFSDTTTEELRQRVYRSRMDETGSCSESCEAQGDLFD